MGLRSDACVSLALALGLSPCACGAPAELPSAPSPEAASLVRLVGRVDRRDPQGPRFAWSATRIEARFTGRALAVRLRAAPLVGTHETSTPYAVTIDARAPFTIDVTPGERRYDLARDLDPAVVHRVALVREAEAAAGVHQLLGFEIEGGALVSPPPSPGRRLEIVGDSITCGYGVLGEDAACSFSYATERASLAYGALAAQALGWDLTTVCWSGRGVYRNYDEHDAPTMPALFELALPARGKAVGAPFSFDVQPAPDAVLVALGTNDVLSTAAAPFEPRVFERAYVTFLGRLRGVYPRARLAIATSPMVEGDRRAVLGASLAAVAGQTGAGLLDFEPQGDRQGCDGHPDREAHRIMGEQLAAFLRRP
jgi:hypothetical protein